MHQQKRLETLLWLICTFDYPQVELTPREVLAMVLHVVMR
jgi:hypothetical protein